MKIISFGEVLFDVINGVEHLGGAPLNLVSNASIMGVQTWLISAVGNDERGKKIQTMMKQLNVSDEFLQITEEYKTGWVDVFFNSSGSPDFTIHNNVAWDNIKQSLALVEFLKNNEFDVFCFGSLAQRNLVSRETLNMILESIKSKEIFFDVNLRQNYFDKTLIEKSFEKSSIIKMNDTEVEILKNLLYGKNFGLNSFIDFAKKIMLDFNLKIVLITKGDKGAEAYYKNLLSDEIEFYETQGIQVKVADTVGAGDAFSAGFLTKYILTKDIKISLDFANKVGAYIATQNGAIPQDIEGYKNFLIKKSAL